MSKRKGTRNEHKAMRDLEADGFYTIRAAGSFGMFDIIAINALGIRLIQVKTNYDASPVEREAIALFDQHPPNTIKEIWIFKDREPKVIKIIGGKS
jgi:Holliday junction resolvase